MVPDVGPKLYAGIMIGQSDKAEWAPSRLMMSEPRKQKMPDHGPGV